MKIFRKLAIGILFLSITCFLILKYSRYLDNVSYLSKDKLKNQNALHEQETAFSNLDDPYVVDSELGAVLGRAEITETAKKLLYRFWVHTEESPEPIDEMYDRFVIQEIISNEKVVAKSLKDSRLGTLTLECQRENTALFKSLNMQFVSSDFDIAKEMKIGDMIYTRCLSQACESVGPECIIVRRASN